MPGKQTHVTEAELVVLQELWDSGTATIRELTDVLYPDGGGSAYATVQKLLERLEGKAFVRRRRRTVPHTFRARVGREELIGRRLRELADQLCEGSLTPLMSHLVTATRMSAAEREELRRLVEGAKRSREKRS